MVDLPRIAFEDIDLDKWIDSDKKEEVQEWIDERDFKSFAQILIT